MLVKECLDYLGQKTYENLFDDGCRRGWENVRQQFGDKETSEIILAVCLSKEEKGCGYSIRLDRKTPFGNELWLELDDEACSAMPIRPCFFFDVSRVENVSSLSEMCDSMLSEIVSPETLEAVRPVLLRCAEIVFSRGQRILQVGSMQGRGMTGSLRLFLDDMERDDVLSCLGDFGWDGDVSALDTLLCRLEPYSERRRFIVDFDVCPQGVSRKIGINFGSPNKHTATISRLLEFLKGMGLCVDGKRQDVLRFVDEFPQFSPYIQNDISHFKLAFQDGCVTAAKAYLRQGNVHYSHDFRAYAAPTLMNLELTTKCPLRCPQCYCDLSGGQDMEMETALFWIREAACSGVKTVNLSGGETLCYPHLAELVAESSRLGIEANIAISGYAAEKDRLKSLIDCGVADICVSLNGSTREINSQSRDGYELAIRALHNLRDIGYERTVINWVMHSFNSFDFPNMIKLAEEYQVRSIAVMMFKPDKMKNLASAPGGPQVIEIARQIKSYKGRVELAAEECFSQLRAILGQRFFCNLNVGIGRGCGAGRDGFSVSVDGYLTPCRHLHRQRERYNSLTDYWQKSPVLQELRTVEDRKDKICGGCRNKNHCIPCQAVTWDFRGVFEMEGSKCPLASTS
ncbi:MAG: radical SAM protein [Schwartzia succinivorans]|nr:radical SAM protein [Schwartzia succinivorans]